MAIEAHLLDQIFFRCAFNIHNRLVLNGIVHGKVLRRIIDGMDLMLIFTREKGIQKLLPLPSALALLAPAHFL